MHELDPLTWEAAATLITGILAVGAAIFVGVFQVGISRRQVEIQESLLRIEELRHKAELYDRRLEIMSATREFATYIVGKGQVPGFHYDGDDHTIGWDTHIEFSKARSAAKFLSSLEVNTVLDRVWAMGDEWLAAQAAIAEAREESPEKVPSPALLKEKADLRKELVKIVETLPTTFTSDLRLSPEARLVRGRP